jgi:hypothetical protein
MVRKQVFLFSLSIFLICLFSAQVEARVIFSDNYDAIEDGWNCGDGVPLGSGYTSQSACASDTYDDVTHYCGEITSSGMGGSGNSLKMWRHDGTWGSGYCGYLNYVFSEEEFNNYHKEIFVRYYMKIPSDWDACLNTSCGASQSANTAKLSRFYVGSSYGGHSNEFRFDVLGSSFQTGKFALASPTGGGVNYTDTLSNLGILDGNWHCYEIHLIMNSATGVSDGECHFYIDGVQVELGGSPAGVMNKDFNYLTNEYFTKILTPGIGNLTYGFYDFPDSNWRAIEFDDYVVSTEYIGPKNAPPSAPSALKIVK